MGEIRIPASAFEASLALVTAAIQEDDKMAAKIANGLDERAAQTTIVVLAQMTAIFAVDVAQQRGETPEVLWRRMATDYAQAVADGTILDDEDDG